MVILYWYSTHDECLDLRDIASFGLCREDWYLHVVLYVCMYVCIYVCMYYSYNDDDAAGTGIFENSKEVLRS
jgi:hypothetical protein